MKIAVYAICLNEVQFAGRFMAACADADVVVMTDTGSTDGTPEALEALGASVHRIVVQPWRFDDARNAALALVPGDVDLCVSLDLDEVPRPGWRQALEAVWTEAATRVAYTSIHSHNPDGSPGVQFINNRIHRRHGYRWRHACHEGLYPDRLVEHVVVTHEMRVDHFPDHAKSRSGYLPLLAAAVAEEPGDARMAHYHARELYYHARHAEAVAEFERYLALGPDCRPAERTASMIMIGKCLVAMGEDGTPWFQRAVAESPEQREPWIELSENHYRRSEWPSCYAAALRGLSIGTVSTAYMSDPRSYGATPDDLASIAAWHMGLKCESLAHARAAARAAPDDERIAANVRLIENDLGGTPPG